MIIRTPVRAIACVVESRQGVSGAHVLSEASTERKDWSKHEELQPRARARSRKHDAVISRSSSRHQSGLLPASAARPKK